MNSADFLVSTLITLDTRISLGHTLGCFRHSLPAVKVSSLMYTIVRSKHRFLSKDYPLLIGSFRLSLTGEVLSAAIYVYKNVELDLHQLVQCTARRIYFVQDPGTYSR